MVVGILSLIFYNDVNVKEYFARINGVQISTPVEPMPVYTPASEIQESNPEPIEEVSPEPVEEPEKPKRIRKIAGK